MEDRRKHVRRRQLKPGTIVFNQATSTFDCVVRNISPDGACLGVTSPPTVPARFELRSDGATQPCGVRWRGTDRVGVQFGDEPSAQQAGDPPGEAGDLKPRKGRRQIDIP